VAFDCAVYIKLFLKSIIFHKTKRSLINGSNRIYGSVLDPDPNLDPVELVAFGRILFLDIERSHNKTICN